MELIHVGLSALPDGGLRAALATDTGRQRDHNEDAVGSFRPAAQPGPVDAALVVADGVGGHEGGQWASHFVVDAVRDTLAAHRDPIPDLSRWLERLLRSIHEELLAEARSRGKSAALGSTATLAALRDRTLTLAHVGDSRAYRLRNGHLEQLTEDDSWVAAQKRAGVLSDDDPESESRKNVLTQCLGIGAKLAVAVVEERWSPGDRYLLCSDGLHGVVADAELRDLLAKAPDPEAAARRCIALANERGGPDNISAVVFDLGAVPTAPAPGMDGGLPIPDGDPAPSPVGAPAHGGSRRRLGSWVAGVGAALLLVGAGSWIAGQRPGTGEPASPRPTSGAVSADSIAASAADSARPMAPVSAGPHAVTEPARPDSGPGRPPTDTAVDAAGPAPADSAVPPLDPGPTPGRPDDPGRPDTTALPFPPPQE